jgi:uncharacterized membrane protein YeaQ/YmgE (transglycosylase-associated protein family)
MKNFSLTYSGIIVMVAGPFLTQALGLSEACGTEIANLIPVLIGAAMSLVGRYRAGGITMSGTRKKV